MADEHTKCDCSDPKNHTIVYFDLEDEPHKYTHDALRKPIPGPALPLDAKQIARMFAVVDRVEDNSDNNSDDNSDNDHNINNNNNNSNININNINNNNSDSDSDNDNDNDNDSDDNNNNNSDEGADRDDHSSNEGADCDDHSDNDEPEELENNYGKRFISETEAGEDQTIQSRQDQQPLLQAHHQREHEEDADEYEDDEHEEREQYHRSANGYSYRYERQQYHEETADQSVFAKYKRHSGPYSQVHWVPFPQDRIRVFLKYVEDIETIPEDVRYWHDEQHFIIKDRYPKVKQLVSPIHRPKEDRR
ncbi:hypothetical protein BGZ54_003696 [Gamsiella multidivaricata]|nr:hypothetical protein BGZ54_003696 [Gamsiella multidivaricata]